MEQPTKLDHGRANILALTHDIITWKTFASENDPRKVDTGVVSIRLCGLHMASDHENCGECPVARDYSDFCVGTSRDAAFYAHQCWLTACYEEDDADIRSGCRAEFRKYALEVVKQLEQVLAKEQQGEPK